MISEQAAQYLTYMMSKVIEEGTGGRARLSDRQVAGKTGTTNSARDAWFVGFTGDYVAGVWMGYDDNRPLTGVTGGGLPADIWHEVMVRIEKDLPAKPLPLLVPEYRLPPAQDLSPATSKPHQARTSSPLRQSPIWPKMCCVRCWKVMSPD